jgi:serine-type D-Ala-D-Ala carboxypeptidase (penicillin-binding protein 5/6)
MPMVAVRGMTGLGLVRIPLLILMLILVGPFAARAATFQTRAPTVLLVDYNSGAILFEKNADRPVAPESTTKILTG